MQTDKNMGETIPLLPLIANEWGIYHEILKASP